MKEIRVDKDWLIEKLSANRAQHREVFLKALDGYRREAIARFEEQIARLRVGEKIAETFHLLRPVNQTPDYDRALAMLAASLSDEAAVLSETDFAQYVQDDWVRKKNWSTSNRSYFSAAYVSENAEIPKSYAAGDDE